MRSPLVVVLLALAVLLVVWRPWDDSGDSLGAAARPASTKPSPATGDPVAPPAPGALPVAPHLDLERSPLADSLNAADGSIRQDLRAVQELFAHYRSVFGGNPTGSNREITRALCGNNQRLFAPLPRDHSAINENGELVDRWQTPFFFHSLSAEFIEVRSAGPDRRLWTNDDLVLSNAPPKPAT